MKKRFLSQKYKKYNARKSKKAIALRKKPKHKRQIKRATNNIRKRNKYAPVVSMKAPSDYSVVFNTEETIKYYNSVHGLLSQGTRVLFDISEIETLTTDAIAVQIAKIHDKRYNCLTPIYGNAPKKSALADLFIHSGFYDFVRVKGAKPDSSSRMIHEMTANTVEPDIAKEVCLLGVKHTFGNCNILESLYDIIIEVMQNTNNHAGDKRGKYDWWLHVYNHPDSKKTSYTFLDLGVGVFNSIPVKTFKRQFMKFFNLTSNVDLVPKLFAGDIKSRTSRPERGKGMPQIFECSQNNAFTTFIMISNDVYADLKTKSYKSLSTKFAGTLFYWEIDNC